MLAFVYLISFTKKREGSGGCLRVVRVLRRRRVRARGGGGWGCSPVPDLFYRRGEGVGGLLTCSSCRVPKGVVGGEVGGGRTLLCGPDFVQALGPENGCRYPLRALLKVCVLGIVAHKWLFCLGEVGKLEEPFGVYFFRVVYVVEGFSFCFLPPPLSLS